MAKYLYENSEGVRIEVEMPMSADHPEHLWQSSLDDTDYRPVDAEDIRFLKDNPQLYRRVYVSVPGHVH